MTYTEFIKEIENNIAKANCNKLNIGEYEEKQKQIYNQIRVDAIDNFANWLVEEFEKKVADMCFCEYHDAFIDAIEIVKQGVVSDED